MIHFGDRRREFLAKLLGDFAKVIVAAMVAMKFLGEVNWMIRILVVVTVAISVIMILAIHPEGRN